MSGGTFDYNQYRIEDIATEIEREIERNDANEYSLETIAEFRKAIKALRIAGVYAQRVDWLLAGDDGEDSFHRRLAYGLKEENERKERQ